MLIGEVLIRIYFGDDGFSKISMPYDPLNQNIHAFVLLLVSLFCSNLLPPDFKISCKAKNRSAGGSRSAWRENRLLGEQGEFFHRNLAFLVGIRARVSSGSRSLVWHWNSATGGVRFGDFSTAHGLCLHCLWQLKILHTCIPYVFVDSI